jgi:hypothetical protein
MGKVIGILPVRLKPGVSQEEFERFTREVVYPATQRSDISFSLLKGERGPRAGQYVLMAEISDIAARDAYWPHIDEPSPAGQQLLGDWAEQWFAFVEHEDATTDYVVINR